MFCDRVKCSPVEGNAIFEKYGIWTFIEECYDSLHLSSDESALEDIMKILKSKGVNL
ncbi:MAG: DUF3791 domain-containing protein [Phascolarctobacterium sp.]|nr:DUF3791 domain-containing protein [Phascolarctobacterium sp.]